MLLFEDLALVPIIFVLAALSPAASGDSAELILTTLWQGGLVVAALAIGGWFLLPQIFAQAARAKDPELFLAASLLVVIVAALATAAVGLSPIVRALLAGLVLAETEFSGRGEAPPAPATGPRAVPRGQPARRHRRRAGDGGGRAVADRRRAAGGADDRRDRISWRGRGDHRAVQGPRARGLPDQRRHGPQSQDDRRTMARARHRGRRRRIGQGVRHRRAAALFGRGAARDRSGGRAADGKSVGDDADRADDGAASAAYQPRPGRLLAALHRPRADDHALARAPRDRKSAGRGKGGEVRVDH